MKIKEMFNDNNFKRDFNLKFLPILILIIIGFIVSIFITISCRIKIDTTYYIDATLKEATIYSFENDKSHRLLSIDGKPYIATTASLAPHIKDGDIVSVPIDGENNILGKENYKVDTELFVDGTLTENITKTKDITYKEYLELNNFRKYQNGYYVSCVFLVCIIGVGGVFLLPYIFFKIKRKNFSDNTEITENK